MPAAISPLAAFTSGSHRAGMILCIFVAPFSPDVIAPNDPGDRNLLSIFLRPVWAAGGDPGVSVWNR